MLLLLGICCIRGKEGNWRTGTSQGANSETLKRIDRYMNRTECSAHFVPNLAEIKFAIWEMIFYGLFSLYQLNRATPHGAPSKPEKSRPIQHELCVHRAFNAFASYNITKTYHLSSSLQFLLSPLSRQFGMAVTDVLGYVSHLSWSWCLSAAICRRFLSNPAFSTVTSLWRRIASGTNAHSSRGTRYGREEGETEPDKLKGTIVERTRNQAVFHQRLS